jgi:hypothetical protein
VQHDATAESGESLARAASLSFREVDDVVRLERIGNRLLDGL